MLRLTLKKWKGESLTDKVLAEIRSETRTFFSENRFLKAELSIPGMQLNSDESEVTLSYNVEKSEQYKVELEGVKSVTMMTLEDVMDLDHFYSANPNISSELSNKIKQYYLSQG